MDPGVDELWQGEPTAVVLENARRKAQAGLADAPEGALALGCDTEVVLGGRVLGKPASRDDARDYLQALSGRAHDVFSGLALLGPALASGNDDGRDVPERSGVSRSRVRFRSLEGEAIDRYLDTGEWRDRAGGYALQGLGAALVEAVEGDVANVVGLPVSLLWELAPELF